MRKFFVFKMLTVVLVLAVLTSCSTTTSSPADVSNQEMDVSVLTAQEQSLIKMAAYTAVGDLENLDKALHEGLDSGWTVNEIGEVILQVYAYAGFPRSLNGISTLQSVLEERQSAGISDSYGAEPDVIPEGSDKYELGVANLGKLIGFPLNQQKADTNGYNEAMDAFLKEHLFADIFERENLSFTTREMATVSILSAMDGTTPQLAAHMMMALNAGVLLESLEDLIALIGTELGSAKAEAAEMVLAQVLERRSSADAAPVSAEGEKYPYIPEIFPIGETSDNTQIFTGDTWVAPLFPFGSASIAAVNVTFSPDSRTTWHSHSYDQVLMATLGMGFYQEEGKEPQKLSAGNTVVIPAGVKHWHGSAPGNWFAHIALIVPVESDAENLWLGPVDEEIYKGLSRADS